MNPCAAAARLPAFRWRVSEALAMPPVLYHHARLALGTALLLAASVASAEDLKLADFQPATHPYVEKVYTSFAEDISAATDGEVAVNVDAAGQPIEFGTTWFAGERVTLTVSPEAGEAVFDKSAVEKLS